MTKLAIIGSRSFNDYKLLKEYLEPYREKISLVISGAAKGADIMGETWAKNNNIKTLIFPADWEKYGKRAGFIRNEDIIKNCDAVIAFWDGKSKGTFHSLSLAKKYNKPFKIINI
jgi:hypothetical protein